MSDVSWMDFLNWNEQSIEDLRFVGFAFIKQGHYDIALNFFETICLLSPTTYDLQTLGALYLQKGENLDALNYLDQSLKIEPDHAPTLLNRTKALFALGYKQQGINQGKVLLKSKDLSIASNASALLDIYL